MKNKDAASIWTTPPEKLSAMKRGGKTAGAKARGGVPMAGKPKAGPQTRPVKKQAASAIVIDKPTPVVVKAAKAKASPAMTRGSMKRSAMPKAETTVRDIVTENKIEAPKKSAAPKRNIQVGKLIGRTGGKWHLGKKVGKG